jgi:hypothetical protein
VSDRELMDGQDDWRKKITRIEMGRKMLGIGCAYVKAKGEQLENQKKKHMAKQDAWPAAAASIKTVTRSKSN